MKVTLMVRNGAFLALAFALTAGGGDMDELDRYINEVKQRPGGRIEPIPEVKLYDAFTYNADAEGVRSPFLPDRPQLAREGTGPQPPKGHTPEYLEQFSLDTLSMVGTMALGDTSYGLVQTSDGLVHRVLPGHYMGQNFGRIVSIDEAEIKLVELISDGIGGYIERDAAISLAD